MSAAIPAQCIESVSNTSTTAAPAWWRKPIGLYLRQTRPRRPALTISSLRRKGLQSICRRPRQGRRTHDHMHRDARQQIRKTSLSLEGFEEGGTLEGRQSMQGDAACDVDATRRQDLHGKIAGFTGENGCEHIDGRRAQRALSAGAEPVFDNHDRGIASSSN